MSAIKGVDLGNPIYEGKTTLVYRCKIADGSPGIVKVMKGEYPGLKELTKFRHEYEIQKNLNYEGIVKPLSLEDYNNGLALVLEDFGGVSLEKLINTKELDLKLILKIALVVAKTLGEIHLNDVIHKDIKPHNIIINLKSGMIKVTDFGIASQLSRENPILISANRLQGTLNYLSPEQTGRMNRAIDYRSDFYSLGITLYELLTGQTPFQGVTDPGELVHCHIAVEPKAPHEIKAEVPPTVSNIIMHLLSKNAEERYQSAYGLISDLRECLNQLEKSGAITDFPVGEKDVFERFQIPQKLYGRKKDQLSLIQSFSTVCHGSCELLTVTGYSGIGKSALVNDIHAPLVEKKGYFITGKFDQFNRDTPYSAFIQAFQDFSRQILSESDDQIAHWKELMLQAVGVNGQILIDVIPQMALIIGGQPPVQELGPQESQNRFNMVFREFVRTLAAKEHPLVIFIDDLQWSDPASLNLLDLILTDQQTQYLMILGAYRDNEVDGHHPLSLLLDELKKAKVKLEELNLQPLLLEDLEHLLADSLHAEQSDTKELAQLLLQKTGGNPFFVNEMLKKFDNDRLIAFDMKSGNWQWDMNKINSMEITDNVVDLMTGKINDLEPETTRVVTLAAAIGNKFFLQDIAALYGKSQADTSQALGGALKLGLLLPVGENYKMAAIAEEQGNEDIKIQYKFLHDRVQQAAYSIIPEAQKTQLHLDYGKRMLEIHTGAEREAYIVDIVSHYNTAADLYKNDPAECLRVARLNVEAAARAKASNAMDAVQKYLKVTMDLFPDNIWDIEHNLALDVHRNRAEAEYLTQNHEKAEDLFETALKNAGNKDEKIVIYNLRSTLRFAQNRYKDSTMDSIAALALVGIPMEYESSMEDVQAKMGELQATMGDKVQQDLLGNPDCTDEEVLSALRTMKSCVPALYIANPVLLAIFIVEMTILSIKHGNSEAGAFSFTTVGLMLSGMYAFGDAYEWGRVGWELHERLNGKIYRGDTAHIWNTFIMHNRDHIRDCKPIHDIAFRDASAVGSLEYAGYSIAFTSIWRAWTTYGLQSAFEEHKKYIGFFKTMGNEDLKQMFIMEMGFVNHLLGQSENPEKYDFDDYKEDVFLEEQKEFFAGINIYQNLRAYEYYLWYNYEEAEKHFAIAELSIDSTPGLYVRAHHFFFRTLNLLRLMSADPEKEKEYEELFKANLEKVELYAENSPKNHLHKLYLVQAEMARVAGETTKAMDLYESAIEKAHENFFTGEEALANELAARFFIDLNKEKLALVYMNDAVYLYGRWRARLKVAHLKETYPEMLKKISALQNRKSAGPGLLSGSGETTETIGGTINATMTIDTSGTVATTASRSSVLDLNTLMNSSRAISGEIKLDNLLRNLMTNVIENAGAQRGILLLEKNKKLFIEAQGDPSEEDGIQVMQSIPVELENDIAHTIIHYVERSHENVVLGDAVGQGQYISDPYIKAKKVKSLLCFPIIHQGKLTGILYLENNLATNAFTPDRLMVLNLLSAQAAISLENASLYSNLEEKVEERTEQLRASKKEVDEIFSNVQQGLLTVNPDHSISSEFSQKVTDIFERDDLGGQKFENLFLMDKELQKKIEEFVQELLTNTFMSMKLFERANPLADYQYRMVNREKQEVVKVLNFTFSRIFEVNGEGDQGRKIQKIMVVIDDKTQEFQLKQELEKKAQEQAGKVEKLYQILQLSPDIFKNFISESSETLEQVHQSLSQLGPDPEHNKELLRIAFREVHTLKGNARALNLDSIGKTAHELEDVFEEVKENPEGVTDELKNKLFDAIARIKNDIQDGNALFEKILNMQGALQSKPKDDMGEFEDLFQSIVRKDSKQLGKEITLDFVNELNKPLGKALIKKLKSPLSHLIRNSLSHGIETPEERLKLNKQIAGNIKMNLAQKGDFLVITCEDDGKGLDTAGIKAKAKSLKLFSAEKLESMSDAEINRLIFSSGLSTQDKVSDIAGRGVGMDAVKEELKTLKAKIGVSTKANQFTRFTIQIPFG